MPRETRHLFYVDGASYSEPQPAVPTRTPDVYYLPRLKTSGRLGVDLFAHQSDARRRATMNARAAES